MTVNHLYLIAALAIPACAPASGTSGASPAPRRSSTVLTHEEITAAHADGGTLYDAISRLRSNWLTRGTRAYETQTQLETSAVVFVDGRRYGELESLRNIDVNQVAEVRYYSAAEAGGKFGMQGGLTGVIEVTMKKR
jgi:hypothetical protein